MRGVTQLKWSTFAGTELWNLSYQAKNNSTAFKQVKYTTKEQYVKALNSIVSEAVWKNYVHTKKPLLRPL